MTGGARLQWEGVGSCGWLGDGRGHGVLQALDQTTSYIRQVRTRMQHRTLQGHPA